MHCYLGSPLSLFTVISVLLCHCSLLSRFSFVTVHCYLGSPLSLFTVISVHLYVCSLLSRFIVINRSPCYHCVSVCRPVLFHQQHSTIDGLTISLLLLVWHVVLSVAHGVECGTWCGVWHVLCFLVMVKGGTCRLLTCLTTNNVCCACVETSTCLCVFCLSTFVLSSVQCKGLDVLVAYLSYIKQQSARHAGLVNMAELTKVAPVLTNKGFMNPSTNNVYFGMPYNVSVDLRNVLPGQSLCVCVHVCVCA